MKSFAEYLYKVNAPSYLEGERINSENKNYHPTLKDPDL